jgi:hypothetical protein
MNTFVVTPILTGRLKPVAAWAIRASIPAFRRAVFSEQVSNAPIIHTTHCDDSIMGDDASASPTTSLALCPAAERDLLE